MIARWLLLIFYLLIAAKSENSGTISGVVLNASTGKTPLSGIEVILRARVGGEDLICTRTVADDQGRFVFDKLPLGEEYIYIPGANRDGVHYPGERVRLTFDRPHAKTELAVCDAVSQPNPLVIRRQEISIRTTPGALIVTEALTIDNPSDRCYVGLSSQASGEPITLQLAVPGNFERTTFDKEFYGRRFTMLGDKLATSVPWPPGLRDLKFTYTVPLEQGLCCWQRPLDLPCEFIRVSVNTNNAGEVQCNLPAGSSAPGETVFQSSGEILKSGHVIRVEMGSLPAPLMSYARWIAVGVLLVLLIIAGIAGFGQKRRAAGQKRCDKDAAKSRSIKDRSPRTILMNLLANGTGVTLASRHYGFARLVE